MKSKLFLTIAASLAIPGILLAAKEDEWTIKGFEKLSVTEQANLEADIQKISTIARAKIDPERKTVNIQPQPGKQVDASSIATLSQKYNVVIARGINNSGTVSRYTTSPGVNVPHSNVDTMDPHSNKKNSDATSTTSPQRP